jgi:hypothetical protein
MMISTVLYPHRLPLPYFSTYNQLLTIIHLPTLDLFNLYVSSKLDGKFSEFGNQNSDIFWFCQQAWKSARCNEYLVTYLELSSMLELSLSFQLQFYRHLAPSQIPVIFQCDSFWLCIEFAFSWEKISESFGLYHFTVQFFRNERFNFLCS